ncbi:acyl-CoA dehydrogenase family protein [Lonsdalea quercina]|uniref:acyl-CoA dehydrogenase family protein n=1 Tax=Lonsdalea quercina TaxID=71657 RepID=UPI0039765EDC
MEISSTHHALRVLAMTTFDSGRDIGRRLEADAGHYRHTDDYALAPQLNRLGLPEKWNPTPLVLENGDVLYKLTVSQRCYFYEALGYIDPNLIFASPTPGMAGFVIEAIGSNAQQETFFTHFKTKLSRSCFAMSEPGRGSDAGAIQTQARKVDGGWRISGEKYFIGNGLIADIGIVFARTAEGPLGLNMFLFEPGKVDGFEATRLPVYGVPGSNISHLRFDDMFLPEEAMVGAHLNPAQRFSSATLATFDNLRPCVGALALGVARALLDHVVDAGYFPRAQDARLRTMRRRLSAGLYRLLTLAERIDRGERIGRLIGLAKADTTLLAEQLVNELAHACDPAVVCDPFFCKAWRDISGFEYTEGTRNIHLLNASHVFKSEPVHA